MTETFLLLRLAMILITVFGTATLLLVGNGVAKFVHNVRKSPTTGRLAVAHSK